MTGHIRFLLQDDCIRHLHDQLLSTQPSPGQPANLCLVQTGRRCTGPAPPRISTPAWCGVTVEEERDQRPRQGQSTKPLGTGFYSELCEGEARGLVPSHADLGVCISQDGKMYGQGRAVTYDRTLAWWDDRANTRYVRSRYL